MSSTSRTVKVKFDGDAKGLAAAAKSGEAEVDRFNKSVDKKFRKSGDDSGKGFNQALKKWFSPSSLGKTGQEGGTVFGSGFLGALKTPVLGPAIAGALTAAVAVAAPAAGAVAASGLVLAFGGGLAALGLVAASKSKPVQDAWSKTMTKMGADTTKLSKPWESTLISMAGFAQRTFAKFAPSLEAVFKEMAPAATKFADQLSKGLERLQPAVRPLAEAFDAVLASLGPATQSAIGNVSNGLIKLSESVKKNPDGLADMVEGVGALTNKTLGAISALNDFNGKIEELTGGTSAVDLVFGKANGTIGSAFSTVKRGIDPLTGVKDLMSLLGHETTTTTANIQDNAKTLGLWTQGLSASQAAAITAGGAVGATRSQFERQKAATDASTAAYNRQKAATDALLASLFRLQNLALGLSGAQISYQSALDDATASVKENGRTLDINTEKGRNNKTALNNLASAANQQTQSMIESNKGTAAAAKTAEASRANFIHLATQMGLSKAEATKLAAQMIAIPNVSRTAKLNANIADLESKLATAKAKLNDPKAKLSATQKATLKAEISNLEAGIATARAALDGLPKSKTVTITTRYTTVGSRSSGSGVGGGHEITGRGNASGGLTQPKRAYLVGERGPELWSEDRGGRITNAEDLRRMLSGGSGGGTTVIENHIEIGGEVVRVVRTEIKASDRETKRRVTAGVGR